MLCPYQIVNCSMISNTNHTPSLRFFPGNHTHSDSQTDTLSRTVSVTVALRV